SGHPNEVLTIGELNDWRVKEVASVKPVSKTQAGNMSRLRERLGDVVARKLIANHVIEHVQRRISGQHMLPNGHLAPPCAPATINVELGYLSELLKLAKPMKGVATIGDPVAEARPVLRLLKMVGKSTRR